MKRAGQETTPRQPLPPRLFVDADVLFAGSATAADHSASRLLLQLAELGLVEAITSVQAVEEVRRNLRAKLGATRAAHALERFEHVLGAALRVVPNPSLVEVSALAGRADPKDLPLFAAALREVCSILVTFNLRDYEPGAPERLVVLEAGAVVRQVRALLTRLPAPDP